MLSPKCLAGCAYPFEGGPSTPARQASQYLETPESGVSFLGLVQRSSITNSLCTALKLTKRSEANPSDVLGGKRRCGTRRLMPCMTFLFSMLFFRLKVPISFVRVQPSSHLTLRLYAKRLTERSFGTHEIAIPVEPESGPSIQPQSVLYMDSVTVLVCSGSNFDLSLDNCVHPSVHPA
jgi:hypothetical protein